MRAEPVDDPQFINYVTNPTLPALLEALFGGLGVRAPTNVPRNDLVAVFLTGIQGLTKPAVLKAPGEMLRLNTSIAPTARESSPISACSRATRRASRTAGGRATTSSTSSCARRWACCAR